MSRHRIARVEALLPGWAYSAAPSTQPMALQRAAVSESSISLFVIEPASEAMTRHSNKRLMVLDSDTAMSAAMMCDVSGISMDSSPSWSQHATSSAQDTVELFYGITRVLSSHAQTAFPARQPKSADHWIQKVLIPARV
ncbi:hypothetical protein OOU_Y34scaffold00519g2 [Pyricularia oryzae Y34]|uniref:Uncharacterized protein n=2 Tax=Pyricularia oryzae TaxID=318829 RepID=A0AA97NYV9_PYRO3|nr:hypothetical protein OOU_Y34scaffold00519g2 [Pyricularia oryzae Y34]